MKREYNLLLSFYNNFSKNIIFLFKIEKLKEVK